MLRISIVAIALVVAAPAVAGEFDALNRGIDAIDHQRAADQDRRSRELAAEIAAVEARQNAELQARAIDRLNETMQHQNVILCCPRY